VPSAWWGAFKLLKMGQIGRNGAKDAETAARFAEKFIGFCEGTRRTFWGVTLPYP